MLMAAPVHGWPAIMTAQRFRDCGVHPTPSVPFDAFATRAPVRAEPADSPLPVDRSLPGRYMTVALGAADHHVGLSYCRGCCSRKSPTTSTSSWGWVWWGTWPASWNVYRSAWGSSEASRSRIAARGYG